MTLTTAIVEAIEEIRETFADAEVTFVEDGTGGAWVTIDPVPMGSALEPATSWIAFNITFPYPEADVYPLFVTPELHRRDGTGPREGFSPVNWGPNATPGIQLSRRSNRLNPTVDTAATKVLKVLKWLEQQ